ncbi:TetR/AcrR family transcriptional regulator [Nocardiopsis aegyptia]|uniref:AcrR family transcriptional regulator n=1 Tax=Nocardiopsis aegyptia TaxID=220378 RepID=A0A7Z0EL11_9ACTN|nr:TetR/AcrR family transcriptional regulator [Nocardiopsis aegyptia]NYJ34028.1 AcrR family transcriptional regulator [Nocardiopsis aegyptia]
MADGAAPVRRGHPAKRAAIVGAARRVFLREGYTRTSVDAIAADACVSKRTIYNHFRDKEELFATIVAESSSAVAEDFERIAECHLAHPDDAEAALVAFGDEWASPGVRSADHGALVRLLMAEAAHFPEVIRVWIRSGPEPVHRGLADRLRAMADRGLLRVAPGEEGDAADHYVALVQTPTTNRSFFNARPVPEEERLRVVRAGVRAFLRIYGPVDR